MSIVYDPVKLGGHLGRVLSKKAAPPKATGHAHAVKPHAANVVELPVLAQDPSVTDLPLERLPVPGARAVDDAELGSVITGQVATSYIDGQTSAQPGTLYKVGDPRFDQQMALGVVTHMHDLYERILQRKLDWNQGQKKILILVRAGNEPNSDYMAGDPSSPDPIGRQDRVELFGFWDPVLGKKIYAAESKDVTAHEGGHGITDRLRPLYSLAFNLESLAFHEGQSDVDAMMLALQDQNLTDKVLQKTGGDLSRHNYLSDIGEEFGKGISDLYNLPDPFIRSADNDPKVFHMSDWRNLPFDSSQGLGSEPHTFSQIWSGAWYDNLNGIYQYFQQKVGMSTAQALKTAGEIMSDVAAREFDFAPMGDVHFNEMALAQLKALRTDYANSPHLSGLESILKKNFANRGILSAAEVAKWESQEKSLPALSFNDSSVTRSSLQRWMASNAAAISRFDSSLAPEVLADLKPLEVYSNERGELFINFARSVPSRFTSADLNDPSLARYRSQLIGQEVPVFGGLTLGFDPSGKLFAYTNDKASPSEIKDTKDYILSLIKQGVIQLDGDAGAEEPEWVAGNSGGTSRVLAKLKSDEGSGKPASFHRTSVCTGFKPMGRG